MSVLIPDAKVYEYISNGLNVCANNTVCNDLYATGISSHFKDKDIEKEIKRLVKSWAYLNELSFNVAYNDTGFSLAREINFSRIYHVTAIQLLKYLQCVSYNIEIETIESKQSYRRGAVKEAPDLPKEAKADMKILNNWITDLLVSIVGHSNEYKTAKWSDPLQATVCV